MPVNVASVTAYSISIIAALILAVYFIREYYTKRLRASIAWALGLLLYAFAQLGDLSVDIRGEVAVGKPTLAVAMYLLALGLTLFYYGTSLLFFGAGSFFRGKMSAVIFVVYAAIFTFITAYLPLEGLKEAVRLPIQVGMMFPIFFVIAVLFYRVSTRLGEDDARRRTVFLVAGGWFTLSIQSVLRGLFLGYSGTTDAVILFIHAIAWVLVLYGMAVGKASKT